MHYHSNHMYCTECHWNGEQYWSRHHVTFDRSNSVGDDGVLVPNPDWDRLIEEPELLDSEKRDRQRARGLSYPDEDYLAPCPTLKPEILEWLRIHVRPPASPSDLKGDPWGWAMGNPSYRMRGFHSFALWFYRRKDAMAFIREWSVHKKPTSYFNYFSGHRWTLDPATGKRAGTRAAR